MSTDVTVTAQSVSVVSVLFAYITGVERVVQDITIKAVNQFIIGPVVDHRHYSRWSRLCGRKNIGWDRGSLLFHLFCFFFFRPLGHAVPPDEEEQNDENRTHQQNE